MGIQQTKSLLKTYYTKPISKDPDEYLQKAFCPEALQMAEFLDNFWDTNANEYFDWTNIQENKKAEEITKEKEKYYLREKYILAELPLNPTITDNLFSIEPIAEYKEAYNPPDSKYFSNSIIKRMHVIMTAYVRKILSTLNQNSSLECIAKYFDSIVEDNTQKFGVEIGMNIFIRLLDDIADKNIKLKEETLNFMVSNSQFIRPLALWGETKRHFLLDKSLNEIVDYLKRIISNKNEISSYRHKAFKVLLNMGLAKGSLKNLLDFTDYYRYIDDYVDFNYELNLFKNEFVKLSLSYPTADNVKMKSKLWNLKQSANKKKEGEDAIKSDYFSLTCDGNYVYIFSAQGYLVKIGSGCNNTMLGKVYTMKENYRAGEKGTIACVEKVIYYRSVNIDPNPVICIDSESLEEIPLNYQLNSREPNHLWVEEKKNDFEFPHTSYKDMSEIIEKKKNMGAEDKANVRPTTKSPMLTDGRFIYIFSKWFDDVDINFDKQVDDDDDEPKNVNKKTTLSIYGVNIYDPLANMSHIKSVQFNLSKQTISLSGENTEIDLLKANTIYYTNGNIFIADIYKFNLMTGDECEASTNYTENLKTVCYDLSNNVIWGLTNKLEGSAEKSEIFCYFNHSAKPVVEYPENNDKYMPCSLEKIIQYAEDLIKIKNLTNEISTKTFLRENTLNILGLEDQSSLNFKNHNILIEDADLKENIDCTVYKRSNQCLILATIAKLSEYYGQVSDMRSANTDEERGKILAQATRRPYCVKLEPVTFEILIKFIDEFSGSFFNKGVTIDKNLERLNNYCLLSTIKILRTNLNCLSVSNLELDFFIKNKNNNPFLKMKEFIFRIFEIYHNIKNENQEEIDIIKALYEECKIILQVSVNTLYPDCYEIIEILEREIKNFRESKYSTDVVKCILEWMSNEENMKNLLIKLKKEEVSRIFKIFEIVSYWEVQNFSEFIYNIKTLKELPKYLSNSENETTAFKFSSNLQIEILKSISKKLLNDNYEEIESEHILHQFSEIIFSNIVIVFRSLKQFLETVPKIIENDWNNINKEKKGLSNSNSVEEEIIDTNEPLEELIDTNEPVDKFSHVKSQDTYENYKKTKYKEIWNYLIEKILHNDLLILRTFNFHINCLSVLSSNYVLSSLMLNSFNDILQEMNSIYSLLSECEKSEEKQTYNDYKEVIFESEHPYLISQTKWFTLEIPGEKDIYIEFDPLCFAKQNCAYVQLYTDMNAANHAFPPYTTINTTFPKETLHYSNGPVYLYFYSDACVNTAQNYGFKVKVHNGKNNSVVKSDDKFTMIMRSVCWVSCKCSAQLLKGNFTKSLTVGSEEDDQKYNNLLNSKLFAGGIDFEDIRRDIDPQLTNIINVFETIIPEDSITHSSPKKSTEKVLLNNILNGEDIYINKIIKVFQKKFSKEVVWAYIGGEQTDSLVRCAFASLLRHSGQSQDFEELLSMTELCEDKEPIEDGKTGEILENNDSLLTAEIEQNILQHASFQSLFKKWQAASRMRTWYVEKKKNVDEALEKSKPFKSTKKEEEVKDGNLVDANKENSKDENNSDEIMKKIIDQTIIKAKFLIKINPSPAFSNEEDLNKHIGQIIVRSSSFEDPSEEDSWKRRLIQWKALQKSKKVMRSVEEEANEKLTSLTSSVLMCLQSTISSKRLFNKIKIATIRAKGREIGLMTIKNIFEKLNHSVLIQDLLAWFCASLRKTETKICHYLDNVSGCGGNFEERIQTRFQEFMIMLINKLIRCEKILELKSFIDALMWKYSATDHKFLVDHSVFLILWGTYNESIKTSWGKPLKATFELNDENKKKSESFEFVNDLLEVFEIVSNICLDRAINRDRHKTHHDRSKPQLQVNIKFPTLEKQISSTDDNNSESLILHILDVIFGEVVKAITSYLRYRGISHRLWSQYEKYEEEKGEEKKKKKEANPLPAVEGNRFVDQQSIDGDLTIMEDRNHNRNNHNDEDGSDNSRSGEEEERKEENKKEEKKSDEENSETPYSYDASDLITFYDEFRTTDLKSSKISKKTSITSETLLSIIYNQNSDIYDPEFLNRILTILYKCSAQHSDKILFSIANPLHFSSLIKLLRVCATSNRVLITKILQNVCTAVPEEILTESVELLMHNVDEDDFIIEFSKIKKNYPQNDKRIFIELIIEIIKDIRMKAWTDKSDSSGAYIISLELITLLRRMLHSENWSDVINEYFKSLFNQESVLTPDYIRKEIILSIFGGDYMGQCIGAKVRIKNDTSKGINFDFIKKEFAEHFNHGTIIGFSPAMEEVWNKKNQKDDKKIKNNKQSSVLLTPNNAVENQMAVLLNDSILKEEFNLMDLSPKIFHQHEGMTVQNQTIFDSNIKIEQENLKPLLSYALFDKANTSEAINLKTNVLRFLMNFTNDSSGLEKLFNLEENYLSEIINGLIITSNKTIQHKTNYINLDLMEEKRFRILNYCAESNFSLAEIAKISVTFRKPNYLLLRLSSDNLMHLSYSIIGANNLEALSRLKEFVTISTDLCKGNNGVILIHPENLENKIETISNLNTKLFITHSIDLKQLESKLKKKESICIVLIEKTNFEEIFNLCENSFSKDFQEDNVEYFQKILSSSSREKKDNLLLDLEEFGFSKELIQKELANSKESLDINTLITNMIEYKEKRKELEDKTEEEKNQLEKIEKEKEDEKLDEEIEREPKNECFSTLESDAKTSIPDYFEELVISDSEDHSLLFKTFTSLNEKLLILYSRRIVLNVFEKILHDSSSNSKFENLLSSIPVHLIINVLKLLTHEGLFLNSINWGSDLLMKIKNVLIKIYSSNKSNTCEQISHTLTDKTLLDLQIVLKGKNTVYEFVSRNEETIIEHPMIFFAIWNLMILNEHSESNADYLNVFDILAGLVMKISGNKQIRWFILDLLIQFVHKISIKIKDEPEFLAELSKEKPFKELENVNKLRIFLDKCINNESKKNLSKRSQMICELLIYLEELDNKIFASRRCEESNTSALMQANIKRDNFVVDLMTTFEMMKEFFDKKYLKYLAWIEMNPEIINSSKLSFESSHLYPKAPHTFLINVPNTTGLEITVNQDSLFDNGDALVFSLDKNCSYPIECYANKSNKKSFTIQSSHTFVHFPSNYLTELYSFGSNTYGRLGQTGVDVFTPRLIESLSSFIVKDIAIGDTFVLVLTENGDLLVCGNGMAAGLKVTSSGFVKASNILLQEKINSEGISLVGVHNGSTIVATKDNSFFSIGLNQNGQLGQAWTSPVNDITSMNFSKRIKQISISETHTMLVSNEGEVYHLGNNDYYQNGESTATRNNTPKIVTLNKSLECEMVSTGEYFTIYLMKDIVSGKRKLYSSGWSKQGRTGTGKDEEYNAFKAISTADLENVEFKYISSGKLCSAAISTNNKLYAWGNNQRGQLGLGHFNDVLEPTLVTFFDKYEVEDVGMSSDHTLVIARDVEKNKISAFGFGDSTNGKLGETITQKSDKKDAFPTPIKISFFEGKNPTKIYLGPRGSIVLCKVKPYETLRDIHQTSCSLCSVSPINGNLFSEISNENLKVYCNDCIKIVDMSDKKPRLLFKTPLKDYNSILLICNKNMDVLSPDNLESSLEYTCKHCKEAVNSIELTGAYLYLEGKIKNILCNNCVDIYPSSVTSAKVYVKVFSGLKNIDITNINNYYENSISYGHKFTVTPMLNEKGCETIIEKHQNFFNTFVEDINEYNKFDVYEQLVDLLNNIAQKAEKSIYTFTVKDLTFKKEELSLRNSLEKCSAEMLRKMFIILKILNTRVKELLPFMDFSKVLQDNQRLSYHFSRITPLIFWDTKNELIKYYLEKTAAEHEATELKINRMKVRRFIDKGKPDHTGEFTLFGQMFQFLKTKSFKIFKKKEGGNNNKMFNVTFVGEASIDAGGPYREALTQACTELQSSALPLFIPSPNQKNESGLFREKWVINPSAKSTSHLEMYKILGGLIGYAMRTGEFLNMDLPSIFWKQLLEATIERKDLEHIDRYTIQCLDDIIGIHKKGVSESTFSFYVDQKFTTWLSDGTEVEIIPGGKDIELKYQDRVKYCELVEKIRLDESKIQMIAIRSGLEQVIPLGLLKLVSWKEIETLVCGKPILDIDLLKENSIYRGCSETENVIQNFWKCLEEFSAEERSMYLRFVWGRSRLPLTSKDFPMKHRIEILHHSNPDGALPTSHTCFFSLEIPKYSTYEILKDKLKYAITHCQAIDTDGRPYEIWQDED